ncbi:hypothetical protein B0H14DRAFT_2622341 [Mycena olivaceomarginata]|nr:hypothetical protein B0H14DRAFT_2622341 [Mycena olivaceomarginata]
MVILWMGWQSLAVSFITDASRNERSMSPIDPSVRKALIVHHDIPHNHPMPILKKASFELKEAYLSASSSGRVKTLLFGGTFSRIDYVSERSNSTAPLRLVNTEIIEQGEPTDGPSADSIHPVASTSAAPPLSNYATMEDVFDPNSAGTYFPAVSAPTHHLFPELDDIFSIFGTSIASPPPTDPDFALSSPRTPRCPSGCQAVIEEGSHGPAEYESDPHNRFTPQTVVKFKSVVLVVDGQCVASGRGVLNLSVASGLSRLQLDIYGRFKFNLAMSNPSGPAIRYVPALQE